MAVAVSAWAGATSWFDVEADQPTADPSILVQQAASAKLVLGEASRLSREAWLGRRPPPQIDVVHPLAAFTDEDIGLMVRTDPKSLGSLSVGRASRGALFNGVHFPTGPLWKLADPDHAWGTAESVEFVTHAIERVHEEFPGGHTLFVGDLSGEHGGRLRPHRSHQSGVDVDLGYYYLDESVWYRTVNARNMDRPRNWALLETLLVETRVQYVFIDKDVQPLFEEYALAIGVDPQWVRRIFHGSPGRRDSIVRHRSGHATHMHVRFENPNAQLTALRSYRWFQRLGLLPKVKYYPERRRRGRKPRRLKRRAKQARR